MVSEWLMFVKAHGANVFYALCILTAGFVGATVSKQWLRKKIRLKAKDPTVKLFIANVAYSFSLIVILISGLTRLGVPTGSLLTVLGAGSLAIALSLKDSLAHVASGLIIVGTKLFHIGDVVEINGVTGTIHQINLLQVKIKTANNDLVVIPNSKIVSDKVCTKGIKGTRRIDLAIGVGYASDLSKAKSVILELMASHALILTDPAPAVAVKELGDSAVVLAVRPWVKSADYTTVLFCLTEEIKLALDANHIDIPYPQLQAHLFSHDVNVTHQSAVSDRVQRVNVTG
jgi:small conductance mechanosensitive channel